MAINPMKIMQLGNAWSQFLKRHSKAAAFLDTVSKTALRENTIIEVVVTTEDGKKYESNLRLTKEDIQVLKDAEEMV